MSDFLAGQVAHQVLRDSRPCSKCSHCHYMGTVAERLECFAQARALLLQGMSKHEAIEALRTSFGQRIRQKDASA